ncbi:MAG: hypothetical protein IJM51_10375 [Clostridia bacterium]|nr:hypothetical protein [Clostridia bacterium]
MKLNNRQDKNEVNRPRVRFKWKLRSLTDIIKKHKSTFIVYLVLRTLVIIAFVISLLRGNYENAFLCVLSLVLFLAPAFITANFGIEFPSAMEIIVLLFIFAAEILGEIQCYYIKISHWDTMLHTINGFLCAACGFGLVDILNRNSRIKFKLSPGFLAMVAFCFSMTVGVMWEFFEYSCDMLLHTDTQKDTVIHMISSVALNTNSENFPVIINNISDVTVNGESLGVGGYIDIGLIDTMKDLFVNFIGALVFSIIGYFYVKTRGKGKFVKNLVPTLADSSVDT